MKSIYLIALYFSMFFMHAQEVVPKALDSLYKEDQFYAGVTYNLLGKELNQSGFSFGFQLGFIKDMPLNSNRNVALGMGLGYAANAFNQNLFINRNSSNIFEYTILDDRDTYLKNTFSTHSIELPVELRWRTSTASEYDFWRIYAGVKFGYIFANTSKYEGDLGRITETNNADFNPFQYGLTLSAGYNTWNVHLYYALNSIFTDDVKVEGETLDIQAIKIGLIFYIL